MKGVPGSSAIDAASCLNSLIYLQLFFKKKLLAVPANLLKKRLRHKCFPVNFGKFLRAPFLHNTSYGCFCL